MKSSILFVSAVVVSLLAPRSEAVPFTQIMGEVKLPSVHFSLPWETEANEKCSSDFAEWLAQLSPRFSIGLSEELFNGLPLGVKYRYQVDPAYTSGLYTRYDKYQLNVGYNGLGSLVEAAEGLINFGPRISSDADLIFARNFPDACRALSATPYSFWGHFPNKAETVRTKIAKGDYVALKIRAGVNLSAQTAQELFNKAVPSVIHADAHYIVSGNYQFHILKLDDDKKIRLKLVGINGSNFGGGVHSDFLPFEFIGWQWLDNRLLSWSDKNFLRIGSDKTEQDLFMLDYELDLSDPGVADAYAKVFSQTGHIKALTKALADLTLHPTDIERFRKKLILNFEPLNDLYKTDVESGNPLTRIKRNFKGSNDQTAFNDLFKFGTRVFKFVDETQTSDNNIVSYDDKETQTFYKMTTFLKRYERAFLFSWSQLQVSRSINALFKTDDKFEDLTAQAIIVNANRKDKRFHYTDLEFVKNELKRNLPESVVNSISFENWKQIKKQKKRNVRVEFELILQPVVIRMLPELSGLEIYKLYDAYLNRIPDPIIPTTCRLPGNPKLSQNDFWCRPQEMKKLGDRIAYVLDRKNSENDRLKKLMELGDSDVFRDSGIGFIISLLDPALVSSILRLDFTMESDEGDRVEKIYGTAPESDIYRKLLYIQSILNNDGLDLRLEAETMNRDRFREMGLLQ